MSEPKPEREKFFAALTKAQSEIKAPTKDQTADVVSKKTGAKYSYTYAGLPAVLDAMRGPFTSNGLAMLQVPDYDPETKCALVVWSLHGHGHSIGGTLHIPCGDSAQEIGSAQTYGKRYIAVGLSFMCPEDDDDAGKAQAGVEKRRDAEQAVVNKTAFDQLKLYRAEFYALVKRGGELNICVKPKDSAEEQALVRELVGVVTDPGEALSWEDFRAANKELKDRIKITEAERAK